MNAADSLPVLPAAEIRAAALLDVGAVSSASNQQEAIFVLANAKREGKSEASFFADLSIALLQNAAASNAQLFQDVFALFITEFKRGGYFVEIGAADGKLISNTYMLEKSHGWTGLLAEPNPAFLPSLMANRSCRIASECVYDITGRTLKFMCADSPEFSRIEAVEPDMHEAARNEGFVEIEVNTISLNDLLDREGAPERIDYMSIDVEGAEFDILQTFDFARWAVDCLTIEHNFTQTRDKIHNLLSANGYVRVFEHLSQWDDWYVHPDALARFPAAATLLSGAGDPAPPPPTAEQFVTWAIDALGRDELPVAEMLCGQALKVDPNFGAAYRTLADVAVKQGRRAVAVEQWKAAVAIDPSDYWARIGLAELLSSRGDLVEAVNHLNTAVGLAEDSTRAQALLEELLPKIARRLPTRQA